MADELTLEIVTPEQMAFRGVVEEVTIPGTEGEFGVLKGHPASEFRGHWRTELHPES